MVYAILNDGSGPMNLLYALCREKGSLAKNILTRHSISSPKITLSKSKRRVNTHLNNELKQILKRAAQKAAEQSQPYIGTEHLLYALFNPPHPDISKVFSYEKTTQLRKDLDVFFSQNVKFATLENLLKNGVESSSLEFAKAAKKINDKTKLPRTPAKHTHNSALNFFCENLTELAESGKSDPVIGREKEIARLCRTLSRRTKNNALLIGDPGVGKTALVHGLAQRINNGEVPENLLRKKVLSLDLNLLVAGTVLRGDFEARMHELIKEAERQDIILFIDEIHNIIGAGFTLGTLDAANI